MTKGRRGTAKQGLALFMSLGLAAQFAIPAIPAYAETTDEIADAYKDQGYHLVWNDEFDGTTLNQKDWNVELHEPGWVNAELQRYTKLDEGNIEVKDGILSIHPKAEKKEGEAGEAKAGKSVLRGEGFDDTNWSGNATNEGASGSIAYKDGQAIVTIENSGTANYGIQVQQAGLSLTQGTSYHFHLKAHSDVKRAVQISVMDTSNWAWYGGQVTDLEAGENEIDFDFDFNKASTDTVALQINFGKIEGHEDTSVAATVQLSEVEFFDPSAAQEAQYQSVIRGDGFDSTNWSGNASNEGASGSIAYQDGQAIVTIEDPGNANYGVQVQQAGLSLETGDKYRVHFKAVSDVKRAIQVSIMDTSNWAWYGGQVTDLEAGENEIDFDFDFSKASSDTVALQINFGVIEDHEATSVPANVTLSDIEFVDLSREVGTVDVKKAYNYTSGRINTQNKHDFTYGYFEARARVPEGQGYLPAFWLMASDEGKYGQWPKCGEIDIMEVKGQDTSLSYHTIHYGYDVASHKENQVKLQKTEGAFYNDFHVYAVDWEPDSITWYVDGEKVGSTSDWHTGKNEETKLTYPAPFDQDFYVILNLAVGGSWVGYPDQAVVDDMENQQFDVDYVRVYQKDPAVYAELEAKAQAPVHEVSYRKPDASGNYVVNGTFTQELKDMDSKDDNFELHLESDNKNATYTRSDNAIHIAQTDVGSEDYSAQLKQGGIPMIKGWEYELTYEAWADEPRTMITEVEGPDNGWIRYLQDTKVNLTTSSQKFTHRFTMEKKTDANGSVEFNLGNQDSTSPVHIANVSIKHVGGEEIIDEFQKSVGADGNYVYNGSFDQGEGRLGYWEVSEDDKAKVSVTNDIVDGERQRQLRVKVEVPAGASAADPVIISQTELAPINKGNYEFSFDAFTPDGAADGMTAIVAGEEHKPLLSETKDTFTYGFNNNKNLERDASYVQFRFTKPGTYYLDNVSVVEAAIIKNGSFNSALSGYEVGAYGSGDATFGVDSQKAGNDTALDVDIKDSGDADWNIQVKQRGIKLEKDHYYKLTYKAKATVDRKISVVMQRDGAADDVWTVYSGDNQNDLVSTWKTFELPFRMKDETDTDALLSISLGTFDERITDVHHVYMDDFVLVETDAEGNPIGTQEEPPTPPTPPNPVVPNPPVKPETPKSTWKNVNGSTVYYDQNGQIEKDAYRDGYYLSKSGARAAKKTASWNKNKKGWWYKTGAKSYLKNTWKKIDGKLYYFDAKGYMASNEYRNGFKIAGNGARTNAAKSKWVKNKWSWSYVDANGKKLKKQWAKIDGKWYYFDADGIMASEEWVQGYWIGKSGAWTYKYKGSWKKDAKGWYFKDASGWYAKKETVTINGKDYNFNAEGYCTNP